MSNVEDCGLCLFGCLRLSCKSRGGKNKGSNGGGDTWRIRLLRKNSRLPKQESSKGRGCRCDSETCLASHEPMDRHGSENSLRSSPTCPSAVKEASFLTEKTIRPRVPPFCLSSLHREECAVPMPQVQQVALADHCLSHLKIQFAGMKTELSTKTKASLSLVPVTPTTSSTTAGSEHCLDPEGSFGMLRCDSYDTKDLHVSEKSIKQNPRHPLAVREKEKISRTKLPATTVSNPHGEECVVPMLPVRQVSSAHRCPSVLEIQLADMVMEMSTQTKLSLHLATITPTTSITTIDSEHRLDTEESFAKFRLRTRSDFSAAVLSINRKEQPKASFANDIDAVGRLFYQSIPRTFAKIECISRVANAKLYSKFSNFITEAGGCDIAFYTPPDLRCLGRLQENGFSQEDFSYEELGSGIRVSLHAGMACREAVSVQRQKSGHPFCICLLLCCPGTLGKDGDETTRSDRFSNPMKYIVKDPTRLYLAYTIDFWAKALTPLHSKHLHDRICEADDTSEKRQDHRQQYQVEAKRLLTNSLKRVQIRSKQIKCLLSEQRWLQKGSISNLIHLEDGSQEAVAVTSLYILGSGGTGLKKCSDPCSCGYSGVTVFRVDNNDLYVDFDAQGATEGDAQSEFAAEQDEQPVSSSAQRTHWNRTRSPSPDVQQRNARRDRKTSPSPDAQQRNREQRRNASPSPDMQQRARSSSPSAQRWGRRRFQQQLVWHGTRLKKGDGDYATLEEKLESIAVNGFDPLRCVKGSCGKPGGIWASTVPLASFGTGSDGRCAFILCAAKTLFNEWVGISSVRMLERSRILPLYVITHKL